mmetsp:Transcript_59632/g.126288  ORF Transcript_59632/g.126288 Transcript_59632/m.126288 type:complete len:214 (-) Transcript_59632:1235-1876(-)
MMMRLMLQVSPKVLASRRWPIGFAPRASNRKKPFQPPRPHPRLQLPATPPILLPQQPMLLRPTRSKRAWAGRTMGSRTKERVLCEFGCAYATQSQEPPQPPKPRRSGASIPRRSSRSWRRSAQRATPRRSFRRGEAPCTSMRASRRAQVRAIGPCSPSPFLGSGMRAKAEKQLLSGSHTLRKPNSFWKTRSATRCAQQRSPRRAPPNHPTWLI